MRVVLFAALVGLVATPAWAQVTVEVSPPSITFEAGPGFHAGSNCFDSYTDFYGAFDFQMGAEFIF